jgi:hypothetical protein
MPSTGRIGHVLTRVLLVASVALALCVVERTPATASDPTVELNAARADLRAFLVHTGLVDPQASLGSAQSELHQLQTLQARAPTDGDAKDASALSVQIGEQQQLVFSLRSELLTYQQIRQRIAVAQDALRRAAVPASSASTESRDSRIAPIVTATLVILLAVALIALILLPATLKRAS